MEPAISVILNALAAGAQSAAAGTQSAAKDVAISETKRIYDWLKSRIQDKWIGKPDATTILNAYEKDSKSWSKEVLAQKLEESGIHKDKNVLQQANKLIQEVNTSVQITDPQVAVSSNSQETVDNSRRNSSGDTVTHGGSLDKSTRTVGSGTLVEGPLTQIKHSNSN